MQMQYAHTPKYLNADGTLVDLVVKFAEFDTELPFAASPTDIEAHGRELFTRATAGEFGAIAAYVAPSALPPQVPQSVTMRQARLALLGAGLLAGVEAAIAALPEPQKSAALIEWEYAAVVQRSSGLVPMMGTELGLTETQLDDLFVAAAAL
jgi:hypothetical protein